MGKFSWLKSESAEQQLVYAKIVREVTAEDIELYEAHRNALYKTKRNKVVKRQKRNSPINTSDVDRVFNGACVQSLAQIACLPDRADTKVFAEGVRDAVRIYAREAREPNSNELHAEIAELHHTAEQRKYVKVAEMLAQLSGAARQLLNERANRPSISATVPHSEALDDLDLQEAACATIVRLCRIGGRRVPGRMRPTGRRSRSVSETKFYAPTPRRHFQKRDVELTFVMWLRVAWLHAVGDNPAETVNPSRPNRPFANFVRQCLWLVGAAHADHIALINKLAERRRQMLRVSPNNS